MQLPAARALVQRCAERMSTLYGAPVFDEWALMILHAEGSTLAAYEGPRAEQVRTRLVADTHLLREQLRGRPMAVGDFAFAPEAGGTAFDACVRVGPGGYLLFNHTQRSMAEIRQEPRWRQAQRPFVELSEAFAADPLV